MKIPQSANLPAQSYLISRPDAIGDVVLTLPMAGWLKEQRPGCRVVFLGRTYTAPIIAACAHVDEFVGSSRVDLQACKLEYSIVSPK